MNKKEHVLEWYKTNGENFPYWFIYSNLEKQTIVDSSPDIDTYSADTGLNDFANAMDRLMPRVKYSIRLKSKFDSNNTKDLRTIEYHTPDNNIHLSPQVAAIGGISDDDVERRIAIAVETQKKILDAEYEKRDLLRRMEEMEKLLKNPPKQEKESVFEKFLDKHGETLIGALIGDDEPKPKAIGGTNQPKKEINEKDLQKNFEDWSEQEPDIDKMIAKISDMAKNNRQKYLLAKSMLLK
jgi:hypothetical protein